MEKKADINKATFDNVKKDVQYIFDKASLFEEKNEENND